MSEVEKATEKPNLDTWSDERLLAAFDETTIPAGTFRHRDHLRVAFLLLKEVELHEAIGRMVSGIKKLAEHYGVSNLYHATVTFMFVLLVQERMAEGEETWAEFEAKHADLFAWPSPIFMAYYGEDITKNAEAKRKVLLPRLR